MSTLGEYLDRQSCELLDPQKGECGSTKHPMATCSLGRGKGVLWSHEVVGI